MLINSVDRDISLVGGGNVKQFSLKPGRHIMSILSNLYTNPEEANVREYLTNMNDAYIALLKKNPNAIIRPPELHLPTALTPTLIFKDYGVGMSPAQVWDVYFEYGNSTKTSNNDEAGGFGLGSKTAFCYDGGANWIIESRYDGMIHTYFAYLDDTGVPTGAHISSVPTSEPNGMTISIPIRREDIPKFINAAKKYVPYFPREIVVQNETIPKIIYNFKYSNWGYTTPSSNWDNGRIIVVMGGVPYPIDAKYFGTYDYYKDNNKYYRILGQHSTHSLVIDVPIGSLDLVPSRDALKYTDKTIKALTDAFEKVYEDILAIFKNEEAKAPTMWDKAAVKIENNKFVRQYNLRAETYGTDTRSLVFNLKDHIKLDKLPDQAYQLLVEADGNGNPNAIIRQDEPEKFLLHYYKLDDALSSSSSTQAHLFSGVFINDSADSVRGDKLILSYFRSKLFFRNIKGNVIKRASRFGSCIVLPAMDTQKASDLLGGYPVDRIVRTSSMTTTKPARVVKSAVNKSIFRLTDKGNSWTTREAIPTTTGPHFYVILTRKADDTVEYDSTKNMPFEYMLTKRGWRTPMYGVVDSAVTSLGPDWKNWNEYQHKNILDLLNASFSDILFLIRTRLDTRIISPELVSAVGLFSRLQKLFNQISSQQVTLLRKHIPELSTMETVFTKYSWLDGLTTHSYSNSSIGEVVSSWNKFHSSFTDEYLKIAQKEINSSISSAKKEVLDLYDSIIQKYPVILFLSKDIMSHGPGEYAYSGGTNWSNFTKILINTLDK